MTSLESSHSGFSQLSAAHHLVQPVPLQLHDLRVVPSARGDTTSDRRPPAGGRCVNCSGPLGSR